MQNYDNMVCSNCGNENPDKHQDFCKDLFCSGKMIEQKYFAHKLIKNKYKINIHAHSYFSDGANSPYHMALEAKRLGFTALVITDHFYGHKVPEFMSKEKLRLLRKATVEAKKVLPVIIGLEIPCGEQEVLIFGMNAINHILEKDLPSVRELELIKEEHHCAIILCHPGEYYENLINVIDGYEHYNGGNNWFKNRDIGSLKGKQAWCNSDAHMTKYLDDGYNIVDTKIQCGDDLIKYIKKGRQPEHFCKNKT